MPIPYFIITMPRYSLEKDRNVLFWPSEQKKHYLIVLIAEGNILQNEVIIQDYTEANFEADL